MADDDVPPGSVEWRPTIDLVMLELGSTQRRLRAAVDGEMLAELNRPRKLGRREFPAMVAERMLQAWPVFLHESDLMRYPIEAKKFYAEGIWADQRSWPWDQAKIEQFRRARVGT